MNDIEYTNIYYESHDREDYMILGQLELFEDHDPFVENTLGNLNLKNKAKLVTVELFLREGWSKPHLHLYNDHFNCAIRLDTNEYFKHGKYQDKLNDKQAKLFDTFMREISSSTNMPRWIFARAVFNNEFPDHMIKTTEQPNYIMINYK